MQLEMQVRAGRLTGLPHLGDRVAQRHLLPGRGRHAAAVGIERSIAVRVRDHDVFTEVGAAADGRDCPGGEARDDASLLRSDVQPVMKALLAVERVRAQAEGGRHLPGHGRGVGEAELLLQQAHLRRGVRRRVDRGAVLRRRRLLLRAGLRRVVGGFLSGIIGVARAKDGGIGVVERGADAPVARDGAPDSRERRDEVRVLPHQRQQLRPAAVQHIRHRELHHDHDHQNRGADRDLQHPAALETAALLFALATGGLRRGRTAVTARRRLHAPPRVYVSRLTALHGLSPLFHTVSYAPKKKRRTAI